MEYKALIGLEMHCEISKTNSKVFSSAQNSYKESSNTNIRPIDMGFPGTLPTLNKEAVKKALMASIILNCKQPEYIYFERKNYYYPDLPKGFQITQETKPAPIGIYGSLEYECDGKKLIAKINNIHLEEDSASSNHYSNYSTLDYNRAGVPLLELVTEPVFHSSDEAVAFLETVRSIYRYAGISDADSKKGQVRCDVNVSIMDSNLDEEDSKNWGTKIEIKNVNSFGGVKDAIEYEIKRQIEAKENGTYDSMEQQTRRYDEETGTTIFMRSKVDAIDYKYFIEPNIPKFKLDKSWIEKIKLDIPKLAHQRKDTYINEYGLSILDAQTIIKEKEISDYYEEVIKLGGNTKSAANFLTSVILGYLNKYELQITDLYLTPKMLVELMDMVEKGEISSKQSKEVLTKVLEEKEDPKTIVKKLGIKQIDDDKTIRDIVIKSLDEHPDLIEAHKKGKNTFDFFVGQVMKATRGQANPKKTADIIREEIDKR